MSRKKTEVQTHVKAWRFESAKKLLTPPHVHAAYTFLFISRNSSQRTFTSPKSDARKEAFPSSIWFLFVTEEWKILAWMGMCFPYTRNLQIGFSHFSHRSSHSPNSFGWLFVIPTSPHLLRHAPLDEKRKNVNEARERELMLAFNEWKKSFGEGRARTGSCLYGRKGSRITFVCLNIQDNFGYVNKTKRKRARWCPQKTICHKARSISFDA